MKLGACVEAFRGFFPVQESRVLVLYDMVYSHILGERHVEGGHWFSTMEMTALLLLAQLMDCLSDYPHCVFSHLCLPQCPPSAQISVISSPSEATVCTTCGYKGSDEDLAEKENPSALDHGSSKSSTEVKDSVSPSFVTLCTK